MLQTTKKLLCFKKTTEYYYRIFYTLNAKKPLEILELIIAQTKEPYRNSKVDKTPG